MHCYLYPSMEHRQFSILKHFLRADPLFRNQDRLPGRRVFAKEERIMAEGEPATDFHLIGRGRVQLIKRHPDGSLHRTMTLAQGSSLGLPAVLAGSLHTATALALTPVHTYPIDRAVLLQFLEKYPHYYHYLAQQLARTLLHYEKLMA